MKRPVPTRIKRKAAKMRSRVYDREKASSNSQWREVENTLAEVPQGSMTLFPINFNA